MTSLFNKTKQNGLLLHTMLRHHHSYHRHSHLPCPTQSNNVPQHQAISQSYTTLSTISF